jgi:Protein of unknown function (DUF3631)
VLNGGRDASPPKLFKVFSPKFFAGISTGLPASTLSRCAVIRLKRKKPGEEAARLRLREFREEAKPVRLALTLWAATPGVIEELRAARPEMPDGLRDRQMDAWEPLFAIAGAAGGTWPQRARSAALTLSPATDDGGSVGLRLLHDIREVLIDGEEYIHLKPLADRLNHLEDGITTREISKHLKPYEIESKQFKVNGINGKGYAVAWFSDAFERYLDPPGNRGPPRFRDTRLPLGQDTDSTEYAGESDEPITASDQDGNQVSEKFGDNGVPDAPEGDPCACGARSDEPGY